MSETARHQMNFVDIKQNIRFTKSYENHLNFDYIEQEMICTNKTKNHLNFVDIEQSPDEDDCYTEADCQSDS